MNKRLIYFTFGESCSGVYKSQVTDVIQALRNCNKELEIQLLAIISPRKFFKERNRILDLDSNAIVLPAIAQYKFWFLNKVLLIFLRAHLNNGTIISRGVFATCLALGSLNKSRIIYDGRGAVAAEQEEFQVYKGTGIEHSISFLECKAVNESMGRIAVSEKLIDYWKEKYNYKGKSHQVIPCTVSDNSEFVNIPLDVEYFLEQNKTKTIFAFAGGNAKWQGVDNLVNFLRIQFGNFEETCAILLTEENDDLKILKNEFKNRIIISKVIPDQVIPILSQCDYGILLRNISLTNKVASPVKVAEYLQAGLKILISPGIGDYSELFENSHMGFVLSSKSDYSRKFEKNSTDSRLANRLFCKANYSKDAVVNRYLSFFTE